MTSPCRILIAEDEPLARERLQRLTDAIAGYQVCGQAADGDQVLSAAASLQPDIVLLDIRMPGLDGLQVAQRLNALDSPPAIIFCTAYDRYAIEAFHVQAVAYLLKPVRREALAQALARAGRVNRVQLQALQDRGETSAGTLAVTSGRGTELIDVARIHFCAADQKYVTIHHSQGETVTDHTLKELESRFPDQLLRIHRQTLVGVRHIRALTRGAGGGHEVRLAPGDVGLAVSRRHAMSVRQWLNEHGGG